MSPQDKIRKWLLRLLYFVPAAYSLNFAYAALTNESGGTFGDTFGAANALFSGAALMMLIYAVTLQRDELNLVKEERQDTRKLLEGQEEITRAQKEALEQQKFEQTFNSFLQIALSERARLLTFQNVGTNIRPPQLQRSAGTARELLENYEMSNDEERKTGWVNDYIIITSGSFTYVCLLLHLATLIDQSCPQQHMKAPLRQIITSQIDLDVSVIIAWYVAYGKSSKRGLKSLEQFMKSYGVFELLSREQQSGFLEIAKEPISTYTQ